MDAFQDYDRKNDNVKVFQLFANELTLFPTNAAKKIYYSFLTILYSNLIKQFDVQVHYTYQFVTSKILHTLKHFPSDFKKSLGITFSIIKEKISTDFKDIIQIFGEPLKPLASVHDFLQEIESVRGINSIICSLTYIKRKYPKQVQSVATLIYHLLHYVRFKFNQKDYLIEDYIDIASHYAIGENEVNFAIDILDSNLSPNRYYRNLNQIYQFVVDEDLLNLANYQYSSPLVGQVQDLQSQLSSLDELKKFSIPKTQIR